MTPTIIQHDNRKAVITGNRVHLFKVRQGNKQRAMDISVWPEEAKTSRIEAWNTALLWTEKCFADVGQR